MLAVGLMSGTSLDGIDAALVDITDEHSLRLVAFRTSPYAPEQRNRIRAAIAGGARELAALHRDAGEWSAAAAQQVLDRSGVSAGDVALVASHGQTVWHEPGRVSLQLGCAATIAERLGIRVVSDFRSRDVAAGGQGAPLVPMADVMLWGDAERGRILLNIGGIANVTWVPRRGDERGALAFDTGPGIAIVDAVARIVEPEIAFDEDGARAARGRPVAEAPEAVLADPYFVAPPPKSTGRERFGDAAARRLVERVRALRREATGDDLIATAVELTAASVGQQVRRWLPAASAGCDVVVSGGGARNRTLMRRLAAHLDGLSLRPFEELYFDGDAKEAAAFAYLGWRTINGLPGNVPSATGASGPRVLGTVTFP